MRDVLVSPDICAYPPERVKVLEGEQATRDNIINALQAMCDRPKPPDTRTFFYFSGHGGQGADQSSYIIPVDARQGQYPTTAISARDLSGYLTRCSGEVTVVLDCCYAAGITLHDVVSGTAPEDIGTELVSFGEAFRNEIQSRGRVVFAGSRANGLAYGATEAPYGILTGHLLDGLRGAASTNGGDVSVQQLFDYIQQRVVLSSGGAQRPSFIASTEAFYPLTRYPRPVPPRVVFEKDVYISYDRESPVLRDWVSRVFQPALERHGVSIWNYSDIGYNQFKVEEAIVKSRYVVALLTPSYLEDGFKEFMTTMAVLQAINTRTPRFIPIRRELFNLPYWIQLFVGLDMTPRREMEFQHSMEILSERVKKQPHER